MLLTPIVPATLPGGVTMGPVSSPSPGVYQFQLSVPNGDQLVLTPPAPPPAPPSPPASVAKPGILHRLIAWIEGLLGPAPSSSTLQTPPAAPVPAAPTTPVVPTPPTLVLPPVPTQVGIPVAPAQPAAPAQPTPAPSPLPGAGQVSAQAVLDATNAVRAQYGVPPLKLDPKLMAVAQGRSDDMAKRNYFAHVDPDGHDPFWHMQQGGVSFMTAGENIAEGQPDAQSVVNAWMSDQGHRDNLLNPNFKYLGVGIAQGAMGPIWTQDFTG